MKIITPGYYGFDLGHMLWMDLDHSCPYKEISSFRDVKFLSNREICFLSEDP